MTRRRGDIPSVIRRESTTRIEGERASGEAPLPVYRSPMVRGGARAQLIRDALNREGLIPDADATDE